MLRIIYLKRLQGGIILQNSSPWQEIPLNQVQFDSDGNLITKSVVWGTAEQVDGSWALLLNCPGGWLTAHQMQVIAEIVADDGIGIKFTGRQAPVLILPKEKVADALAKLDANSMKVGFLHGSLRNVKACLGIRGCKNSRSTNVMQVAQEIDHKFFGVILPWDFKIGISGCSRNCAAVACQSLGLVETKEGFDLYLGGSEGINSLHHGQLAKRGIPTEKIVDVVETVLKLYIWWTGQLAKTNQLHTRPRFYEILAKAGLTNFINAIDETLGQGTPTLTGPVKADLHKSDILPGFNRENVFNSYLLLEQLCAHCSECKKSKCHLYIAKETIIEASRTGKKFMPGIPSDILEIIHALPMPVDKFETFKLHDAYFSISEVCDQCHTADHDPLCAVNVALTAIGCLINGRSYQTPKDRDQIS